MAGWDMGAICFLFKGYAFKPREQNDRMLPGVLSRLILQAFETAALEGTRN
jgi:hypothetical protein